MMNPQLNNLSLLSSNRLSLTHISHKSFAAKSDKLKKEEKKQKEKEQVHQQFEGQDLDTIKKDFDAKLDECIAEVDEALKLVKSGRASPNIFDHLEVHAYNEKYPFSDMCQVIVKGSNLLMVKVFDENIKDDVLKALSRSEFDINCTLEGKDIKVKLGTSKKEHIDAALKQIKGVSDSFKMSVKDVRQEINDTFKKLQKILPQEEIKVFQKDIDKLLANKEAEAKKLTDNKEKEVKQG